MQPNQNRYIVMKNMEILYDTEVRKRIIASDLYSAGFGHDVKKAYAGKHSSFYPFL